MKPSFWVGLLVVAGATKLLRDLPLKKIYTSISPISFLVVIYLATRIYCLKLVKTWLSIIWLCVTNSRVCNIVILNWLRGETQAVDQHF